MVPFTLTVRGRSGEDRSPREVAVVDLLRAPPGGAGVHASRENYFLLRVRNFRRAVLGPFHLTIIAGRNASFV